MFMGVFQGHVWERQKIYRRNEIHEPESPQSVKERGVKWLDETIVNRVVRYWSSATARGSRCWTVTAGRQKCPCRACGGREVSQYGRVGREARENPAGESWGTAASHETEENGPAGTKREYAKTCSRGIGRDGNSAMFCANQCDVALYVIATRYSGLNTHSRWA
jgi:hypothetical protein